jgi:uncharacterized pyridoxamine 5'-phosphate oxidase family protein
MEKVLQFLKDAGTYYLATVEGDQPRVRPFGTANVFEGKLYIQTGKSKNVSKQIHANPKVEVSAFKDGVWIRIAGELVEDDRREARASMLDAYPNLRAMYQKMTAIQKCFISKMLKQLSIHLQVHRRQLNSRLRKNHDKRRSFTIWVIISRFISGCTVS